VGNRAEYFIKFFFCSGRHALFCDSILKNGSLSHRNTGLNLIQQEPKDLKLVGLYNLPRYSVQALHHLTSFLLKIKHQYGKRFLLDPYAVDKGNSRSTASL